MLSLREKLHKVCIDDSIDVWCGDGLWQPTLTDVRDNAEVCDDGNLVNNDGCSNKCTKLDPLWKCANTKYDKTNCTYTACGNGVFDSPEPCDDGNIKNGDGCDKDCKVETGYYCHLYGLNTCYKVCRNGLYNTYRKNNAF